jgi:predicted molibdopterin-dependent oxidoreductase YjgC
MTDEGERVSIRIDGVEVDAAAGQSVGAALVENGILSWRATRALGRPRGLFCGIGACYDCLVTIDGGPNRRACVVPVAAGMTVETAARSRDE